MSDKTRAVLASLLTLPVDERAEIAEKLLASLDGLPDPSPAEQAEIDAAWAAEIERRLSDMDRSKLIPFDTAMEMAKARIKP